MSWIHRDMYHFKNERNIIDKMEEDKYEKLLREVRHITQKSANDIFMQRSVFIMEELRQHGVPVTDEPMSIKKGRPKK